MNKPVLNQKSVEITRGALPGSRKVHVNGVPFREVRNRVPHRRAFAITSRRP